MRAERLLPSAHIAFLRGAKRPACRRQERHAGCGRLSGHTEAGGGSVYVRIDNVEEHKDAVETMMKSLEFADDIAKAKTEAMDVKLEDIEIKR